MRSELLRAFATIVEDHQQQKIEHPTDDLGWPICTCESCQKKTERMGDAFIDSILRHGVDPERVIPSHDAMAEIDYDGGGGREWQDAQRDRARASSHVVDRSIPHVSAPSIVPEKGEAT